MRIELEDMEKKENSEDGEQEDSKEKRVYESDLTRKEKIALERKKLSEMNFRQKIEYMKDYYAFVLIIILIVGVMIYTGAVIYHNKRMETILSVAIVDDGIDYVEQMINFETELDEYYGIEGEKYKQVKIDSGVASDDNIADSAKMMIMMNPDVTDVFICDKATYEIYHEEDYFTDWKEILGDDYASYEQYVEDDKLLSLAASEKWKDYELVSYEPAYLIVTKGAKHEEEIQKLVEFFLSE